MRRLRLVGFSMAVCVLFASISAAQPVFFGSSIPYPYTIPIIAQLYQYYPLYVRPSYLPFYAYNHAGNYIEYRRTYPSPSETRYMVWTADGHYSGDLGHVWTGEGKTLYGLTSVWTGDGTQVRPASWTEGFFK